MITVVTRRLHTIIDLTKVVPKSNVCIGTGKVVPIGGRYAEAFTTPRPKSLRLPRRNPVTFILGMKCADGLVLCADTLETDGVTKSYRVKLASLLWDDGNSEWGICWGASGHAFVCDKFKDKMRQTFKDQPYNRAAIEDRIEVCLEFVRQSYTAQDGIAVVIGLFGRTSDKGVIRNSGKGFSIEAHRLRRAFLQFGITVLRGWTLLLLSFSYRTRTTY